MSGNSHANNTQDGPTAGRELWLRLCWMTRAIAPQLLGLILLFPLLRSVTRDDLTVWSNLDYAALGRFDFSTLDLDSLVERFTTFNIVTKLLLAWSVLVLAAYASDLATTARRIGWQLIAPVGQTRRLGHFRAWLCLAFIAIALPVMVVVLVLMEICSFPTAFKIMTANHLAIFGIALLSRRTYEAYLLQVPVLEQRRERRREDRRARAQERRTRREEKLEQRRQRRAELREQQAQYLGLQREYETLGAEIRAVERSDHRPELIAEQVARLRAQRAEIAGALRDHQIRYPERS